MKTPWCSLDSSFRGLGLSREKVFHATCANVSLRFTSFRLPSNGTDCFQKINNGCWYCGMPTTGTLVALLRALRLCTASHDFQLPGATAPMRNGFLAIDAPIDLNPNLKKLCLWWIDVGSPYAYRVALRFKSNLRKNIL